MEYRILEYLKEHKTITALETAQKFGTLRLGHYIWVLRNRGFYITDEWVHTINKYGDKIKYKKYILEGEEK